MKHALDQLGGRRAIERQIGPSRGDLAGKVRVIAQTPAKRSALAPDLPSVAETLSNFDIVGWYGLAGPAAMPRAARSPPGSRRPAAASAV